MVLYRQYRPQSLDELVGQETAKQALLSAYFAGKLSHAYLLCGPRGTGKTSTARILAKMVNCSNVDKKSGSPCNSCSVCLSITDGSNLDLIEIDAASNRGIDDIRSLKETIKLSPTASPKKVYIIDEAHMLTTEAFNALLKTLEEPPSHVLFILATTETSKIPQTILSRVSKLEFSLATPEDIVKALKRIVKQESINIDDEALLLLAQKSGGSFRDGVKLLDQLSSQKEITKQIVEQSLGTSSFEQLMVLLNLVAGRQPAAALTQLHGQLNLGVGVKELNSALLDLLRQLLLIHAGLEDKQLSPQVLGSEYQQLRSLSKRIALSEVIRLIDLLQKSVEQGKTAPIVSLPLEVAIMEGCIGHIKSEKSEDLLTSVSDKSVDQSTKEADPPTTDDLSSSSDDIQLITDRWQYILETVRPHNYSLEALLRSATIKKCEEKIVRVEVPYSFHQRILEAAKARDLLESVLSDVLGRSIRIAVSLGQRSPRREDLANIEVAADDDIIRVAAEIFSSETIN